MRVHQSIVVDRPPKEVWSLVGDLERSPEFFAGITKWDPKSEQRSGVGARYRVLMQIGSIQAGGTIHVTEWEENRLFAWESETGIEMTGRTEIEPEGAGTRVHLEIAFTLPGPAGWLVERITGRIVGRNLWATLLAARRMIEHDEHAAP
ncbi:MAG: SRPBCC family protein [Actinomycetota bacterium]